MKKILVFITLCLFGLPDAKAQLIQFGIKAGPNFANLEGSGLSDSKTYTSFHFGALVEIKLFENFSLQPELLYSSQGAKVSQENVKDINFNYFTVPTLAKFYLISNKFSLEVGPQFSFLINESVPDQFRSKSFDFAAVGGLGLQLTDTFFIQARYVAGLSDTSTEASIKNKVIQLSLGYNF